jgi:hypothetical protein
VENCRPLQPCSQHCGLGRVLTTRGPTLLPWFPGDGASPESGLAPAGVRALGASYEPYAAPADEEYPAGRTEL